MVQLLKIGHAEFQVRDLSRMADYYAEVIGLTVTNRTPDAAYLSTLLDHHSVVLRRGSETRLTKVAFEVSRGDGPDALVAEIRRHGVSAESRSDSQPGIGHVVRTVDPDGIAVELYTEPDVLKHSYIGRGVNPAKLSHIATLALDPKRTAAFYMDVLGMRFSDSIKEFFYFLRCGCDHHTVNLLAGEYAGLQHLAFEMADAGHLSSACDELARHKVDLLWGPLRHGVGHNLAAYHLDPEGQIIEFATELDRISNEGLGYFDPRPYHTDFPQRPKVWTDVKAAGAVWGTPPPPAFGRGIGKAAAEMMGGPA